MSIDNPSIISHVSVGTNDFAVASTFYDAVFAAIGGKRIMEHPGAVAYGKQFPEFWVQLPIDRQRASVGNGVHVGLMADSKEQVDAFFKAALANGGKDAGEPGEREQYSKAYYGCFVRDPDGNKIEAMYWDYELAKKLGY